MSFTEHTHENGVTWLGADHMRCRHAFLTKLGGVSTGTFAGLNLSATCGDEPASVLENYRLVGEALGIDTNAMVFTYQVHESEVRLAGREDIHTLLQPVPYKADGLLTTERGLPILVMTADCVPVLLEDADAGVVSAVHCGWRGTAKDILAVAVGKMTALGARPEDIRAAIGPSIGKCCFETGPEVPEALYELLGEAAKPLCPPEAGVPGKFMVDLRGACRQRLMQLGLTAENIAASEECTMCQSEKYWSHRATKGLRGIQANIILLD